MQSILASQYGLSHCDAIPWKPFASPHDLIPFSADDYRKLKWIYPNLKSLSGHYVMPCGDLDSAFADTCYLTFIREPIRRMASAYQQMRKTNPGYMSFEAYCDIDTHRDQQCQVLGGCADAQTAIDVVQQKNVFTGLLDRFDESLVLLKALRLNELCIDYERVNTAPSNDIAAGLLNDNRTLNLLEDANKQDQILYTRLKDEVYSRQIERYGEGLESAVAQFSSRKKKVNKRRIFMARLKRKVLYEPAVKIYRAVQ